MKIERCPACNRPQFERTDAKTGECRSCGYHERRPVLMTARALLFCDQCGVHFLEFGEESHQHDGHPIYCVDTTTNRRSIGIPPHPVERTIN